MLQEKYWMTKVHITFQKNSHSLQSFQKVRTKDSRHEDRKLCSYFCLFVCLFQLVFVLCADISTSVSRFTDIHLGITQPSVFDVPPECKDAKPLHSQKVMEIDDNGGVWEKGVETMKGFA